MHDKYLNSEAISPRNNRMSLSEVAFDMEMDDDFEEGATCTLHSVWTEREAREALDGSHWECRRSEDHVQLSDEASASARPPARLSAESTKSSHHGQQPSYECVVHELFDNASLAWGLIACGLAQLSKLFLGGCPSLSGLPEGASSWTKLSTLDPRNLELGAAKLAALDPRTLAPFASQ